MLSIHQPRNRPLGQDPDALGLGTGTETMQQKLCLLGSEKHLVSTSVGEDVHGFHPALD